MTLHEVCSQIHELSIDGFFNREKFTLKRLENQIGSSFRAGINLTIPHTYLMEIALLDGWWYFTVSKHGSEYSYWIPDTRDQEKALLDRFEKSLHSA